MMGFNVFSLPAALPADIVNTDGLKDGLFGLLGIGIIAVGLVALFAFGTKKSGVRALLSTLGGVLIVFLIVGLAGLVGTSTGRDMVSAIFNF